MNYLSEEIAAILAIIYVLSVIYSLQSGRQPVFGNQEKNSSADRTGSPWDWRLALAVMLIATGGVGWMSHLFVDSVEHATRSLGLNHVFVGVIVVAIVANAAEHSTAVMMAVRNKLDLAMHIAIGSSIQIALLVAPVLVFASLFVNDSPLDLHFTPLEILAVVFTVGSLGLVAQGGEVNWMEGVLLLGVYAVLALAFYHLPAAA